VSFFVSVIETSQCDDDDDLSMTTGVLNGEFMTGLVGLAPARQARSHFVPLLCRALDRCDV